ncbi:MAG: GNAT family N-acetyltransferase [Bacteroidetes bacterium]|nr:GNAT family N-acetyltransferase [Bacteroidota bacterium]
MIHKYIYQDQLQTPRLQTRFLTRDDATAWAGFFADKECGAFIPDFGFTDPHERAKHWMERQLTRYAENRYGLQALINRETGEFIGQCGLMLQDVDGIPEIEVGYHIFRKYWGQGYAPEASAAFTGFWLDNHLSDSLISIIDVNNVNSQRVADKNGLTRTIQTKWMDLDIFVYRISRETMLQNRDNARS